MEWYDPNDTSEPLVSPGGESGRFLTRHGIGTGHSVAPRVMMLQSGGRVEYLRTRYPLREDPFALPGLLGERTLYRLAGARPLSVVEGGKGAPAAVDALEVAVAMGCEWLFALGVCSGIAANVETGDMVVPLEALREEGTSFHYELPEVHGTPDEGLAARLTEYLAAQHAATLHKGRTVSTDAIYRQTRAKATAWRESGVLAADMEMSALLTVAKYRGVRAVGLFVVTDRFDLGTATWHRGGRTLPRALDLATLRLVEFARTC